MPAKLIQPVTSSQSRITPDLEIPTYPPPGRIPTEEHPSSGGRLQMTSPLEASMTTPDVSTISSRSTSWAIASSFVTALAHFFSPLAREYDASSLLCKITTESP